MSSILCRRGIASERGSALVAAMATMAITLSLGFAALSLADFQTGESGRERVGESAFNLTEGALSAQLFVLSQGWPGTAAGQFPPQCDPSTSANERCPDSTKVSQAFDSPDYAADASWLTIVRDNGAPTGSPVSYFYDDATTPLQPAWDANGDGRVWVRARATVRGKVRTLVALVKVEQVHDSFPRSVLTTGKFSITPSGKQVYIDAGTSNVQVRCTTGPLGAAANNPCAGYEPGKGQISPENVVTGYQGGATLTNDALYRFKKRAQAEGTYCGPEGTLNTAFCSSGTKCPLPGSMNRPGGVIYVNPGGSTRCDYAANIEPCCNTEDKPGLVIFETGKLEIRANVHFDGIIYMANKNDSSANDLLHLNGGMTLHGAAIVDGDAGFIAGSNGLNLIYNPNVFNAAVSYGTAGIIRNTWREIPGP